MPAIRSLSNLIAGSDLLSVEDDVIQWERYYEVLFKLYSDVEEIFRPRFWYDDKWQYHEEYYIPDKQTPYLLKLSELLSNVCNFVKSHLDELNAQFSRECDEKRNAEIAFEAWKRSLCLKLIRELQRCSRPTSFDNFESLDEIAKFLKVNSISINYNATREAIDEWQATILKKSA